MIFNKYSGRIILGWAPFLSLDRRISVDWDNRAFVDHQQALGMQKTNAIKYDAQKLI